MNQPRRDKLAKAEEMLQKAGAIIEKACNEELDAMDNTPPHLECNPRYKAMEMASRALTHAQRELLDVIACVRIAKEAR